MKEYDIYRDSALRYLGYSNEVGEAFRPLIPRTLVNTSYAIAVGYVCADVYDKTNKSLAKGESVKTSAIKGCDVFLWQMIASVIIPGITINRITWLTARAIRQTKIKNKMLKILPTAVGLASIPFIIHPIDRFVDYLMDNTYRKWI